MSLGNLWNRLVKKKDPRPVVLFGLKASLYKNDQVPNDTLVLAVHPSNFDRVHKEVVESYARFIQAQSQTKP